MYIILIHYHKSESKINIYKESHKQFLRENIKEGNFLTTGKRSPKTGEVILSCIDDLEPLQILLSEDPYYKHRIGHYEIIEFYPDMSCQNLKDYMLQQEENY